ncbi:DUF4231 domain-containing protein [Cryptosporangium sp. NPDC051539]|uniref:DUF4231 domain-containing protein n=1 Tax=Cryptosporangium sp. NPDC051539 TaxID=3363962 RepID=UPI0037966C6E
MGDDDLPAPFAVADAASLRGQTLTQAGTAARLGGALLAAAGGAAGLTAGRFDLVGVVAAIGFAVALGGELLLLVRHPERDWYHGRAVAESLRTLGWKYAVGGAPFDAEPPGELLDARVGAAIGAGRGELAVPFTAPAATTAMEAIRALPFAERRERYARDRIGVQLGWYTSKAAANRRGARWWRVGLIGGEAVALGLVLLLPSHWAGVLAVAVVAAASWAGVKRYEELAAAYTVTAAELGLVAETVRGATEAGWARVVSDAEQAISREHTLWLAARADPGKAR